jgi:hypothetical protein
MSVCYPLYYKTIFDPFQALCYLSVSYVQKSIVPGVYDLIMKLKESESYKTKISMLEFLQVIMS